VAIRFSPGSEIASAGQFVLGKAHLLLLDRPASEGAIRVHAEKWKALWRRRKDQPGRPEEYILPGRATAVVVHSVSKLQALTLPQVQAVFQGKIRDWKHLGALDPKVHADTRIRCYGLYAHTPAGALFEEKAFDKYKRVAVTRKKTSAQVLSALAVDPRGIGFVSAAELPPDPSKAGVKVLAITAPGPRQAGKPSATKPTAAAVLAGRYPLARRLHLYVSPGATAITRDFVKFITTGGRSAANPYTDVPGAVGKIFRAHGLLPPPEPNVPF
jgi:ABC-type phosphate transport system substrate-binding protein